MSIWSTYPVRCPCGEEFSAQLADGLHITRVPQVRERILEGTFHNVTCPSCAVTRVVHTQTVYTDFDRHHFLVVAPPWEIAGVERWSEVTQELFDKNLRRAAPPMIQSLADKFVVRLVFGFDALADKLRCWDAGLDDRLVECVKSQMIGNLPSLGPSFKIRLIGVDKKAWTLEFAVTRPDEPGYRAITTDLEHYVRCQQRQAELERDLPWAFDEPMCSLDSHFAEVLAATATQVPEVVVIDGLRPQEDEFALE